MISNRRVLFKNLTLVTGFTALFVATLMFFSYPTNDLDILELLKGPLSSFDEDLLKFAHQKFLYPPSGKPYNLKILKSGFLKESFLWSRKSDTSWNIIYEMIKTLYPPKSGPGFFVEAGAYDGEHLSNSLYLELELGWSGLLVEPSKSNIKTILTKNRRAWFCPCCLATKPYPHRTFLQSLVKERNRAYDAMNSVIDSKSLLDRTKFGNAVYEEVQCFPLQTLLKAINQTHVDLVSLDVEDVEELVLKNFSWNEINVDIWIVEHRHPENGFLRNFDKTDPVFVKWFNDKGYVLYKVSILFLSDYVFIKRESSYYKRNKERLQLP